MPIKDEQRRLIMTLGIRIRQIREAKNISQCKLAHSMGKDRQSLSRLEKGKVNPGYLWLLQICEALDITMTDLFQNDLK
jgi:putative transcriptional regulator